METATENIPNIDTDKTEKLDEIDRKEDCDVKKTRPKRAVIDAPRRNNIGIDGTESHEFK